MKRSPATEEAPVSARRFLGEAALAFALLLACVVYGGRALSHLGSVKIDLSGSQPASLSAEERAFFAALRSPLQLTYFVSDRRRMPSDLKRVETEVRALLARIEAQNPDRIDVLVVDPDLDPENGSRFAASKKVSPISVRKVKQDESSEVKIWSSLVIGYGDHPEALIQGITDAHLPGLRALVVENIRALEAPPVPVFAVAAPPRYKELRARLAEYGKVVDADPLAPPPEADALFWLEPGEAGAPEIEALQKMLAAGKSVVLAGAAYGVSYETRGWRIGPVPGGMDGLLRPFGVSRSPDILIDKDKEREALPVLKSDGQRGPIDAPFHLRIPPINYDLKRFFLIHIGALAMPAASPLLFSPRKAAEAGYRVEVTATSGLESSVFPAPESPRLFTGDDFASAVAVPKQPVFLHLLPEDPWRGRLLVLGSARVFDDPILADKEPDRLLLKVVAKSLGSPQQLVLGRVKRPVPPAVPPLSQDARVAWRVLAVFLVPGFFALAMLLRFQRDWRATFAPRLDLVFFAQTAAAVLLLSLGARLWQGRSGGRLDLTSERVNSPAPAAAGLLAGRPADLSVTYAVTARGLMPSEQKGVEDAVRERLQSFGLAPEVVRPDALTARELEPLAAAGLRPFQVRTVLEDREVTQQVWNGLVLRAGGRAESVPRLESRNVDHLEFLVAAALERLKTKSAPLIAVASDLPRLSPAEAFMDYQQKGYTAPSGTDVYGHATELLKDYGYRVLHVDPKRGGLPDKTAFFIWFQPRFDNLPTLRTLAGHLEAGGKALVTSQWFNIQQRQYRGLGFKTVYWPQPQYQDLQRYTAALGITQVKEVLMDRTFAPLSLETQVNRAAKREYEQQQVAQPFLIRTVADNMSRDSVITSRLGDQLFVWGNRFQIDASTFAATGLKTAALVTTSEKAWSYDWNGGWLPEDSFEAKGLIGRQPLALEITGRFPPVEFRSPGDNRPEVAVLKGKAAVKAPEGALLLVGSSEMFKNEHLEESGFRHDQLLLNAAAYYAHGPEMAALQARERAPRGFPFQSAARKALWRLFAVFLVPAALIAFALRLALEGPRKAAV